MKPDHITEDQWQQALDEAQRQMNLSRHWQSTLALALVSPPMDFRDPDEDLAAELLAREYGFHPSIARAYRDGFRRDTPVYRAVLAALKHKRGEP